jgi:hypothetical protein
MKQRHSSWKLCIIVSLIIGAIMVTWGLPVEGAWEGSGQNEARQTVPPPMTNTVFLPLVVKPIDVCAAITTTNYNVIPAQPPPTDRPAHLHADLNLGLRGYTDTTNTLGLVDYSGDSDAGAPQLPGLFVDNRVPTFTAVAKVYNWDYADPPPGRPTTPINNPPVTLAWMQTAPGEIIQLPNRPDEIYGGGYKALVLYATTDRLTLKYTRDDNVISGYTLHLENVCTEPNLLALYEQQNNAGRGNLPALTGLQPLGRSRGVSIGVAIQDNGAWLDPRSRKDWWQGR